MNLKDMVQAAGQLIEDPKHTRISTEMLITHFSEGQKEVQNRVRILRSDKSDVVSVVAQSAYTPTQSRIIAIERVYYDGDVIAPTTRDFLDNYEANNLDAGGDNWDAYAGDVESWIYDFFDSKIRLWKTPEEADKVIRIVSIYGPADLVGINAAFELPYYCERAIYLYGLYQAQRQISVDYKDDASLRQSQIWQVHSNQNIREYENAILQIQKLIREFQPKRFVVIQNDNGMEFEEDGY